MIDQIFDKVVIIQDKSLTGDWKSFDLFILVILLSIITFYIYYKYNNIDIDLESIFYKSLKLAFISIVINFVSGKLFKSRQKIYKQQGFSKQRAKLQAYSDARFGHILTAIMK